MDHILIKGPFWHRCEMSLHHPNERLVRSADGDAATSGISISPGRFAALSLKEGTDDEGNNNHAGRGACAFELLVRRSSRPPRQKKPAHSRPIHENTNIG
jgi:hypothetical protein